MPAISFYPSWDKFSGLIRSAALRRMLSSLSVSVRFLTMSLPFDGGQLPDGVLVHSSVMNAFHSR